MENSALAFLKAFHDEVIWHSVRHVLFPNCGYRTFPVDTLVAFIWGRSDTLMHGVQVYIVSTGLLVMENCHEQVVLWVNQSQTIATGALCQTTGFDIVAAMLHGVDWGRVGNPADMIGKAVPVLNWAPRHEDVWR